jgi:hypothetical protein
MARSGITLFILVGCISALGGCKAVESMQNDLGWNADPKHVELTEDQPGDVPVPDGFTMVTKGRESFSVDLGSGGFRDGHLVYIGDTYPPKVARFFETTMVLPTYGWKDRTDYQTEGDRTLKFVKGRALCTVVITRTETAEDEKTKIEIDIVSRA